jgi:LasA protease
MNIGTEDGRTFGSAPRSPRVARLLAMVGLSALCALVLAASGAAAQSPDGSGLEQAVVDETLDRKAAEQDFGFASADDEQERTLATVMRQSEDGKWAFGSAVISAPKKEGAYPETWFFVAEQTPNGWEVVLEGEEGFVEQSEEAPATVVEAEEKEMFAAATNPQFQRTTRTGLRLPWKRGAKWRMTGGPHGWSTGYDRPYSALDFNGRGRKVRAAAGGRVYSPCGRGTGFVRVMHRNGWQTYYYHLRKTVKPKNGKFVESGTVLGYTGTTAPCGGYSTGPHVHFALMRYGKHVPVDGKTIGGWTFHEGAAYKGYAKHGKTKRLPGQYLKNFGPT